MSLPTKPGLYYCGNTPVVVVGEAPCMSLFRYNDDIAKWVHIGIEHCRNLTTEPKQTAMDQT